MSKYDPRQVEAMRQHLREQFGIINNRQLAERIRETLPINYDIFRSYGPEELKVRKEE